MPVVDKAKLLQPSPSGSNNVLHAKPYGATMANDWSRQSTTLESRHIMAFLPDEGIKRESLAALEALENKLSDEDHAHDIQRHNTQDYRGEGTPTLSPRNSFVNPFESIRTETHRRHSIAAVAFHVNPKVPQHAALIEAVKKLKANVVHEGPAYDWVPRPYTKHRVDIEKRRARKAIDVMNSSKEDFFFSERDKRVKFAPSGMLIFHVLEMFNLSVNSTTFINTLPVSFYCVLNIGSVRRCSKLVHSKKAVRVRMDFAANFSIDLSEWRESTANKFYVELWSFQDPEAHFIVGTRDFHVYEFIRKQHAVEIHNLWSDGVKMGKMCVEYAFTYGYYGYGHSNQFKNPRNPIMETVSHSMYPRIKLGNREEMDQVYQVRLPDKLKCFTYNSLILEMDQGLIPSKSQINITKEQRKRKRGVRVEDLEPKPMIVQQVRFEHGKPAHCKLHMNIWQTLFQADFNDSYGEFVCIGNRKGRMDYLSQFAQGRMRDIRESEAGVLFQAFQEREAEKVLITEINRPAGYLIHPQKVPCSMSWDSPILDPEDEDLLEKLPSVRRESGYLAKIFGYEKKPPPETFINDMDYPLYKESYRKKRVPCCKTCCRNIRMFFLRLGAFLNWLYNFIFPEVRRQPNIPEVSVTTPTPEGSTTDIFTYFIRDQKDYTLTKVEQLQSQVTAFMESIEAPLEYGSDDVESESSSDEDKIPITPSKEVVKRTKSTLSVKSNKSGNKIGGDKGGKLGKNVAAAGHRFKASLNQPSL